MTSGVALLDAWVRFPDLLTSACTVAVAVVVLRAAPRRPENQFFALFLALIALNFAAGFVRYGVLTAPLVPGGPEFLAARTAERAAVLFQAFDPAALLYLALLYPRRDPRLDRPWMRAVLFGAPLAIAVLDVAVPWLFLRPEVRFPSEPLLDTSGATDVYVVVYYLAALGLLVRNLVHEASPLLQGQLALLVAGFAVAVLPRVGLLADFLLVYPLRAAHPGSAAWDPTLQIVWEFSVRAVPTLLALLGVRAYLRRRAGGHAEARRGLRLAGYVIAGIFLVWFLSIAGLDRSPAAGSNSPLHIPMTDVAVTFLGGLTFSVRWIAFACIVGYALLRYQVLEAQVRVRRLAEAGTAAGVLVATGSLAWFGGAALGPVLGAVTPGQLLAVVALLALAPASIRGSTRWVRAHLPEQGDPAVRRLEMYRIALERALRGAHIAPEEEAELRALRRDLGITEEQHRILEGVARSEALGRARGPLLVDGRLAGRYETVKLLGSGGSGRCLLALDGLLGREVVVKEVLHAEAGAGAMREARAAGRLNHPNIVTVHDVLEEPGRSYLVMEHVPGGSLRGWSRGALPVPVAVRVLDDILAGLEAAHTAGIVHGDVKPENVLMAGDGRAKLADFGSAAGPTSSGTLAALPSRAGPGTLLYMAPEQVEGGAATKSSDLYAVAVVAHELLADEFYLDLRGKGDFQVREAILRAPPRPPPHSLPPALVAWLQRGLAKRPEDRWPDAATMRAALRQAAAGARPRSRARR